MKIRKWDKVEVISWKEKDRWVRALVEAVYKDKNKVLVKWVNVVTRHMKKTWTTPWQIVKMEKPIHVSSVMLVCPFTDKPTRLGYVLVEEKWVKKKFRFSKKALKEKWGEAKSYIIK